MPLPEILAVLMVVAVCVLLFAGYPVALTLGGVLLAIPLFIFMGVMLERSQIAEELLETMGRLFGALPGGLGISVLLVGVLLAAAKGVVGATTVTIGLIMLPTMLRHGYDPRLAAGTVAGNSHAGADISAGDRAGPPRRPD